MTRFRRRALAIGATLTFFVGGTAESATTIKGAAILDNPCGKVSVKQMGLMHAGKFEDANKLTTKEMQDQWKSAPAKDRAMMMDMAREMSQTEADYTADIKSGGVLMIDGASATLTVQKKTKDANGTSTSTMTQNFKLSGSECLVGR
ncbi:MAG: hypothetical protein U1F41_13215 [Burkholderiales bacterium]